MRLKFGIFLLLTTVFWSTQAQAQRIRFNVGGAKYTTVGGDLSVTITVDTLTPTVVTGNAADQSFRDDTVGAAFFGYYLTCGLRTQGQAGGTVGNIKIRRDAAETSGRSYYLIGNGTTVPTAQSSLTIAPAAATTFASIPRNSTRCGPNWSANGVSGVNGVNCGPNPTVAQMDITQFVKVLFTDPPSAAIVSFVEFTVVNE
jgi:hypothetical protein